MRNFKIALVFILCVSFGQLLFAQEKLFNDYLPECNLEFKMPKGYASALHLPKNQYVPVDGASSLFFYFIQPKNPDILIGFTLMPYIKPSRTDTSIFKKHDPNNSFGNTVKHQADTGYNPIYHYTLKELENINAEKAVRFDLKLDRLFIYKYSYCKAVAIHRDNIGDGFIYYFYNNGSKGAIDKEIQDTKSMLKFRPDSLYKPMLMNTAKY